jgi:hypothetical protein
MWFEIHSAGHQYCDVSLAELRRCTWDEFNCVFDTNINEVQSFIAKTRSITTWKQLFIIGIRMPQSFNPHQGNLLLIKPLRTSMVYGIRFHETPILIDFIHTKVYFRWSRASDYWTIQKPEKIVQFLNGG